MPSASNDPKKARPVLAAGFLFMAMALVFYALSPGLRNKAVAEMENYSDLADRLDKLIKAVERHETDNISDIELPPDAPLAEIDNNIRLNGVFFNPDEPMALINNHVLRIGDTVEGFLLVDIKEDSVILKDGQGRETAYYLQSK